MKCSTRTDRVSEPVVYIVESDRSVRDCLAKLLVRANRKVTCFDSAEAFLNGHRADRAGCLVLEIQLPGMDGLALQALLRERQIDIPVIFVTGYGDVSSATRAMRLGAFDFLEKPADAAALRERVDTAIAKDVEQRKRTAWRSEISGRIDDLSDRERAVLDLVLDGRLNKQIAEELGIARRTVEDQRSQIMAKMQVSSVAELVRLIVTYESGV